MPIRAEQHEILDRARVELDATVNHVVKCGRRPVARNFEANDPRRPRAFELCYLVGCQRKARAVVLPSFSALLGFLSLRTQPLGGAVAVIRLTLRHETCGRGAISLEPL